MTRSGEPGRRARRLAVGAGVLVGVIGLAGCGWIDAPTARPTITLPTVTLPSIDRPTALPTIAIPTVTVPRPSITSTEAPPTATPPETQVPSVVPPTVTVTPAPVPSPDARPEDQAPPNDSLWLWLAAAVAAVALASWTWLRLTRRRAWDARLASVHDELVSLNVGPVADVLTATDGVRASTAWLGAQPRLKVVDSELQALADEAPDEDRRGVAATCRRALAALVGAVNVETALAADADADSFRAARAGVQAARDALDAALRETPHVEGRVHEGRPPQ